MLCSSLPLLRVTLTHRAQSSHERAIRLPTSFPISGLARLRVKPRLCRSSWRACAPTHPLMLPSTSPREALLACFPSPPWNLPSFTVESTFSSPWSPSLAKMWLSLTLTPSTFRSGAWDRRLWSFSFRQRQLWRTCQLLSLWHWGHSFFSACPVCSSFSAEAYAICMLLAGLGSSNKPATSLLFSSYQTLAPSPPRCPLLHLSFYFNLFARSGRNCLFFSVLSGYNGSPDTRFSR